MRQGGCVVCSLPAEPDALPVLCADCRRAPLSTPETRRAAWQAAGFPEAEGMVIIGDRLVFEEGIWLITRGIWTEDELPAPPWKAVGWPLLLFTATRGWVALRLEDDGWRYDVHDARAEDWGLIKKGLQLMGLIPAPGRPAATEEELQRQDEEVEWAMEYMAETGQPLRIAARRRGHKLSTLKDWFAGYKERAWLRDLRRPAD